MGREETRSAVMERGATALTIRGRAWPFWDLGGFGRQGGGGPVGLGKSNYLSTRFLGKGEICRRLKPFLFFFSYFCISPIYTYTYTSRYSLLLTTYCYTILSYSPNPTLLPKPRETHEKPAHDTR